MRIHLTLFLIWSAPLQLTAAQNPTTVQLLDKYAETQDKLNSFIIKGQTAKESSINVRLTSPVPTRADTKTHRSWEVRFDGQRVNSRVSIWGNATSPTDWVPESSPAYKSNLWDNQDYWRYSRGPTGLGRAVINKKQNDYEIKRAQKGHSAAWMTGTYPASMERLDKLIREARRVSVRDKTEKIKGVECYVIDADTKCGEYSVWLDPQHGYNVAKAKVELNQGKKHLFYGRPFEVAGKKLSWHMDNIRFEKIDDVWVPVEAYTDYERIFTADGSFAKSKTHHKFAEIILNPDHDALGSFVPDDIPNGAEVYIVQVPNIHYTWQNGELIPNIDELVIDQLDKMAEEIMAEKPISDANGFSLAPSITTVSDLLGRYRATQDKLQSFIAKGGSFIEYVNKTRQSSRKETEHCEFRFDGNRVNHRSTFWDGLLTTKDKPGYKSFLWDGKSFIEYRRAEELKNSRVFVKKHNLSKKRMIATEYKGAALMGICGGDYDRIDSILGKAEKISLRDKTDKIEESDCFVIDAETKRGKYTVWFDPQHGCNIAKIEVQREKDDLVRDRGRAKTGMSFSLENVRFEQIDAVWVPMEADMQQTEDSGAKITKWHHKRTEMILNPDHDVVGSFLANDIPDGIKVIFPGRFDKTAYVWQNGKPVTEAKSNVEP